MHFIVCLIISILSQSHILHCRCLLDVMRNNIRKIHNVMHLPLILNFLGYAEYVEEGSMNSENEKCIAKVIHTEGNINKTTFYKNRVLDYGLT